MAAAAACARGSVGARVARETATTCAPAAALAMAWRSVCCGADDGRRRTARTRNGRTMHSPLSGFLSFPQDLRARQSGEQDAAVEAAYTNEVPTMPPCNRIAEAGPKKKPTGGSRPPPAVTQAGSPSTPATMATSSSDRETRSFTRNPTGRRNGSIFFLQQPLSIGGTGQVQRFH